MQTALVRLLAALLGLFFGFVGYHKVFASLADLQKYGSWTVHLPEIAGRLVGASELLCALALLGFALRPHRWLRWVALILILNQIAAAAVHWVGHETAALPQNAVLVALLTILALVKPQPAQAEMERP